MLKMGEFVVCKVYISKMKQMPGKAKTKRRGKRKRRRKGRKRRKRRKGGGGAARAGALESRGPCSVLALLLVGRVTQRKFLSLFVPPCPHL